MELTTISYHADEFCNFFKKEFKVHALSDAQRLRKRKSALSLSEVIAIAVYYHQSDYKTFKDYYTKSSKLRGAFPTMPSYNRFIELQQKAVMPLALFARLQSQGQCNGISFIDSFPLRVSHQKRIYSHRVFRRLVARGKTSKGWFYGFKLHVVINSKGQILNFAITPGNIADNNADIIEQLKHGIYGKVCGDKGYLLHESLFQKLFHNGIHIITKIRKNMRNKLMDINDKVLLRKRGIVESVGAIFKEDLNFEHSRCRSPLTLFINVFSGLIS